MLIGRWEPLWTPLIDVLIKIGWVALVTILVPFLILILARTFQNIACTCIPTAPCGFSRQRRQALVGQFCKCRSLESRLRLSMYLAS